MVTIDPGAEPAGVRQERVLRLDHGRPDEEGAEALAALTADLLSRWLAGAAVLIRSRHAVNRGPLVAALILGRPGVEASVAVQLIRDVHSDWVSQLHRLGENAVPQIRAQGR